MTIERVVDAHVHLWDPARADWYPYLAGMQELDMGDISGMCRRFDQSIYFSESAKWNVREVRARGGGGTDEAGRRDPRARRSRPTPTGHPDVLIGGLDPERGRSPSSSASSTSRSRRRASAASGSWAKATRRSPRRRCCRRCRTAA